MPGLVVLIVLIVIVSLLVFVRRVTVFEHQRAVQYTRGRFVKVLGAGPHWTLRPFTVLRVLDIRSTIVSLTGQELLSKDGIPLKVSLAARYQVADAQRALERTQDYRADLYMVLQMALRELIGTSSIEEVLDRRNDFGPRLLEKAAPAAEEIGLRVLSADVKDIMLAADVKKVFTQVVRAQKEGLAALEKARGESAALRNLANAARMLEDNPALLQLRVIQQLGESSGNTVVLNLAPDGRLLPIKPKHERNAGPEEPAAE